MDRHPIAVTAAIKSAVQKATRIKELGLSDKLDQEAVDKIITDLATAKALLAGQPVQMFLSGQEWYVNSLIEFSKMSTEQKMEFEYNKSVLESATYDEGLALLDAV